MLNKRDIQFKGRHQRMLDLSLKPKLLQVKEARES